MHIKRLFFLLFFSSIYADSIALFIPPEGWECVQPTTHQEFIQIGFRKGSTCFLTLAQEKASVPLKKYLELARKLTQAEGIQWRDLGDFSCRAGVGRLIELKRPLPGEEIQLQAILIRDDVAYVLTAGACKDQFAAERTNLLTSLRTLQITENLFSVIEDEQERLSVRQSFETKTKKDFQKLITEHQSLGSYWQFLVMKEYINQ